jgi:LCP family protein required for cell wall assembly
MDTIRSTGSRPNHTFKINALWPLGRQYGAQVTKDHISQTLGINFHYYVKMNLSAFRDIVDAMGGVEIEVPRAMFWYDPCDRPPLRIDIPAGVHQMDGQMAEHFVRFRSYPDGDIGRISAQQQFMTQLFRQMLSRDALLNNPIALINIIIANLDTNFRALDAVRYVPYIALLRPDGFVSYTLPGVEQRVHGQSMWIPKQEETLEIVRRLFHGMTDVEQDEDDEDNETMTVFAPDDAPTAILTPTHSARISVLNGSNIGGLARTVADDLELSGFNITEVGIYRVGAGRPYSTQIRMRQEDYDQGLGIELVEHFQNAVRRVQNIPDDFDIQIVVGISEQ